jgi:hypothetical protein
MVVGGRVPVFRMNFLHMTLNQMLLVTAFDRYDKELAFYTFCIQFPVLVNCV